MATVAHPLRIRRPHRYAPLPEGAVLVARKSRWSNPFVIGPDGTRAEVIEKYETWLLAQPNLIDQLPSLRGRRLACYCPLDEPCHADVLARLANREGTP